MKKAYNKWFFTKVKRAIRDYNMIQAGDRIAVGVSGGKDSSTLLYILSLLRKHSHLKFDFQAVTLDLGQGADLSPLVDYCRQHDIPLHIEPTKIGHIVFNVRQETNPCSLCANLRRGALHQAARKLGCNKVALGHHLDDAIETLLMNIIFTGKLGTFSPWVYLDRMDLTLIRPMIYLPQETVVSLARKEKLPIIHNPCPANGHTQRQKMQELVNQLAKDYPDIRQKILTSLQNVDFNNLWKQRRPLPQADTDSMKQIHNEN
ncbi:MAG: tRNA 2-thiocytidine(32) synthetase TtcA [Clostridia bacterium]|jgi:tRNA 2-thiocytidine biosynthesis protein TtcA|nr:tRNA 2-thiocytidine(32) synthetase TtcA [Clostridia bacterium]